MKKKILSQIMNGVATLAVIMVAVNVNSCCAFYLYQDELPMGAERFRRNANKSSTK